MKKPAIAPPTEPYKPTIALFIITKGWVKKIVAVNVKQSRYCDVIMSRLDEWRGVYYWPHVADEAHLEMATAAQQYCQRLDRLGAVGWNCCLDRTWSELCQEKFEHNLQNGTVHAHWKDRAGNLPMGQVLKQIVPDDFETDIDEYIPF